MTEITSKDIEALQGFSILEFGAAWCTYCQNAQPHIASTLKYYPHIKHIKIEDGKGMRLGRLYAVKFWPTIILLNNGKEVNRVVRPNNTNELTDLLNLTSLN